MLLTNDRCYSMLLIAITDLNRTPTLFPAAHKICCDLYTVARQLLTLLETNFLMHLSYAAFTPGHMSPGNVCPG